MKVWTVKFKGYNTPDYEETVSARDEKEAFKKAQNLTVKRDDRDQIESIKEDYTEGLWWRAGKGSVEE